MAGGMLRFSCADGGAAAWQAALGRDAWAAPCGAGKLARLQPQSIIVSLQLWLFLLWPSRGVYAWASRLLVW